MAPDEVVAAFDQLSSVYDATRDPIDAASVERLVEALGAWGLRRFVEVGVGTGRVALPLAEHGLEVTGVDASRAMLAKARSKGLSRLVRGSAYRLPVADGAADATLFVHVLHLLDDPARAIAEGVRVGRKGAVALVEPRGDRPRDASLGAEGSARRAVYAHLRARGYSIPARAEGPRVRDRELLDRLPPDATAIVSEGDVSESVDDQLRLLEKRASRWTLRIPPELLAEAVAAARRELGERTLRYHRVRLLARWSRAPVAPAEA